MTNSNENTLFAQKEQAPKHLTFSAGVKRLRSHSGSLSKDAVQERNIGSSVCAFTSLSALRSTSPLLSYSSYCREYALT